MNRRPVLTVMIVALLMVGGAAGYLWWVYHSEYKRLDEQAGLRTADGPSRPAIRLSDFVGKWHSPPTPGTTSTRESWLTIAADGTYDWKTAVRVGDQLIEQTLSRRFTTQGSNLVAPPTEAEVAASQESGKPFRRPEVLDVEWLDEGKTRFQLRSDPAEEPRPHLLFERVRE